MSGDYLCTALGEERRGRESLEGVGRGRERGREREGGEEGIYFHYSSRPS